MKRKTRKTLLLILLTFSMLVSPHALFACGPFFTSAIFTFTKHPDFPLDAFARGNLGVLQPTYARSYLLAAYRNMMGTGFNEQERSALLSLWKERLDFEWNPKAEDWFTVWREARKSVGGVGETPEIGTFRAREKPNDYESYLNCHRDAFYNAAATLKERVKKFGASSPLMKSWVEAQDVVFSNCSEGQRIPSPAPAQVDPLIRADRAYQIAAANFYAARFDEAQNAFDEIARDKTSPWRTVAPYLAARAVLRKATLGEDAARAETLTQAEARLNKVLNDTSLSATHTDAKGLLRIVRLRLHPEEMARELSRSILAKDAQSSLRQDVWDYTLLLDKFVGEDLYDPETKQTLADLPAFRKDDDLTDWLLVFQIPDKESLNYSLQKWQQSGTLPWLVAAISKIEPNHPQAGALISAADKVRPDSPAFASAAFHSIRLMLALGRDGDARAKLDSVLAPGKLTLPRSAVNEFTAQRLGLAKDLGEFLRDAQRVPAALSVNFDGRELPEDVSQDSMLKPYIEGRTLFDLDAASVLNQQLPLATLKEIALDKTLPNHLRARVAVAAWVRSVMLDDRDAGRELAPTLESLVPELKGFLNDELIVRSPEERKFSAIYALLKFPGLRPEVDYDVGRTTPFAEIDSYRDNWWCYHSIQNASGDNATNEQSNSGEGIKPRPKMPTPPFITEAMRATAARQLDRLVELDIAPNYLTRQAIAWAEKSPDDPRVPEALHLAIKTTRYGCPDEESGALSRAAFQLLHKRYPKSEWAKKTPYWFKA